MVIWAVQPKKAAVISQILLGWVCHTSPGGRPRLPQLLLLLYRVPCTGTCMDTDTYTHTQNTTRMLPGCVLSQLPWNATECHALDGGPHCSNCTSACLKLLL